MTKLPDNLPEMIGIAAYRARHILMRIDGAFCAITRWFLSSGAPHGSVTIADLFKSLIVAFVVGTFALGLLDGTVKWACHRAGFSIPTKYHIPIVVIASLLTFVAHLTRMQSAGKGGVVIPLATEHA